MPLYYHELKPTDYKSYWPIYSRLALFSAEKEIIFDYSNEDSYIGVDSMVFSEKLNELTYLLYWLAMPSDIQEKLPSPQ